MTQKELDKVLGTQGITRVSFVLFTQFIWLLCNSTHITSMVGRQVIPSSASSARHSTLTSTRLCSRCPWLREKSPTRSVRSSRPDTCSKSVYCVLARLVCTWRRSEGRREEERENEMLLDGFAVSLVLGWIYRMLFFYDCLFGWIRFDESELKIGEWKQLPRFAENVVDCWGW